MVKQTSGYRGIGVAGYRAIALLTAAFLVVAAGRAGAQEPASQAAPPVICLTIDATQDTLELQDRGPALILLGREFTQSGWRVVTQGCTETYAVSHVVLGRWITVRIEGPRGVREGRAAGLEDLPALYSQMARSFVTGKPLGSLDLIDRDNVTEAQTTTKRVAVDTFHYARLGGGVLSGDRTYAAPVFGLGYRAEFDTFALDVAYLTYQVTNQGAGYGTSGASSIALFRIAGLHFFNGKKQASSYAGGGLSWGWTQINHSSGAYSSSYSSSTWAGSGLRGEVTGGYEFTRATRARTFVQADLVLPFYRLAASSYSYPKTGAGAQGTLYSASLTISVGVGWHRERD